MITFKPDAKKREDKEVILPFNPFSLEEEKTLDLTSLRSAAPQKIVYQMTIN